MVYWGSCLKGPDQNATLACLQSNLDLCADNPLRRALLELHVNTEMTRDDLQYFCHNQHGCVCGKTPARLQPAEYGNMQTGSVTVRFSALLTVEQNCTNYQEASRCSQRVASKLQDSLTLTVKLKPYLDAQCL
nr:hypothetical protein BaRGS_020965 [Batillaria attramentaria]